MGITASGTRSGAGQKPNRPPGSRTQALPSLPSPLGTNDQFDDALGLESGHAGDRVPNGDILDENSNDRLSSPVGTPRAEDHTIGNPNPTTPTTVLEGLLLNRPCACLATLYLILDEQQQTVDLQFPSGLALLRSWWERIKTPLQCVVCPQRYVTSVQNTQLISTVLISMAASYRAVLMTIDADAELSTQRSETMTWTLADPPSDSAGTGFVSQTVGHYVLDLDPNEWRVLARKTVRAEIFGVASSKVRLCLLSLVDELEARQVRWHESPPCPDIPLACIHGPERTPFCILHCREARRQVDLLGL